MSSSTPNGSELEPKHTKGPNPKPKHTEGSGKASLLAKKDANSQDTCAICLDPLNQKVSCGTCLINIFRGNNTISQVSPLPLFGYNNISWF